MESFLSLDSLSPPLTSYLISPPPPCDKKEKNVCTSSSTAWGRAQVEHVREFPSLVFMERNVKYAMFPLLFLSPPRTANARVYLIWMCEGGRLSAGAVSDSI